MSWHLSPGEKIPTHPVRCIASYEVVAQAAVGEDVSEKQTTWFKPARDVFEKALIVFQMLEHLDRNNTIKLTSGDIEIVDVTCYDDKICDSALASFSVNILFLGLGV